MSDPDTVQVEVWDYVAQEFVPSIRCPGERRVRVDYFGDLSNLAVFEVRRDEENPSIFYPISGDVSLNWRIDLS